MAKGQTPAPVRARIFAYQVGFGDCFLMRIEYSDQSLRHILIDFGTTGLPKDQADGQFLKIANDIKDKCSGKLNIVVGTHRHADHISGFARNAAGTASGDIIRALSPDLVLQPWTEAPDAPVDSLGPVSAKDKKAFASRMNSLTSMHAVAQNVVKSLDSQTFRHMPGLVDQLRFVGEDNLSNKSAVENLATMGKANVYGFHGCDAGMADLLPGIAVHVLGPPTLRQTDTIRNQKSRDKDEFWQLAPKRVAEATGTGDTGDLLFPDAKFDRASKLTIEQRWLAERVDKANGEQLLGLVRALDDQMNNTSLILLFKAGTKTLLFPGDAQIENWDFALQQPETADLLAAVDVYKVGHHGSLNATPKSMWAKFAKRGDKKKKDRMTSIMSTMKGKHGREKTDTEVPRRTLVAALDAETNLHSTDRLAVDVLYDEVVIELA